MAVEIAAGRQLGAALGQSVGMWTIVLSTALLMMAAGSVATPSMLARWSGAGVVSGCLAAACAACLVSPWLLRVLEPFAFLPPAVLAPLLALASLAPVAPLAAAMTTATAAVTVLARGDRRMVSAAYAVQAAGAVAGTLFTGLFLLLHAGHGTVPLLAALFPGALAVPLLFFRHTIHAAGHGTAGSSGHPLARRLPAVAFLCGAAFLGLEVAAGRFLAATFGQSVYTWTAVITAALAGSALGSAAAGRSRDAGSSMGSLARLLVAASFCIVVAVPAARALADPDTIISAGIPVASLLFALALAGPPAFVLGAMGPVLARRALAGGAAAPKVYGMLFAASAAGNLAGAIAVAGALLPWAGAERTFVVLSCLPAAALLLLPGAGRIRLWATVPCMALLISLAAPGFFHGLLDEPVPGVIYRRESRYSTIRVVADPDHPGVRRMVLDRLVHSKTDINRPDTLLYDYTWVYDGVIRLAFGTETPLDTLSLGGGGYVFPRFLMHTRPGGRTEVAEIDPAVTRAAVATFGLDPDSGILIRAEDARRTVRRALREGRRYHAIFGDTFNHYAVPAHLTTVTFHRELCDILTDDGVYMLNLIDLPSSARFVASMVLTCREVFPHVWLFDGGGQEDVRETYVVVCAMQPLPMANITIKAPEESRYRPRLVGGAALDSLLERGNGLILTDHHAPVELLLAPASRQGQARRLPLEAGASAAVAVVKQPGALNALLHLPARCRRSLPRAIR